MPRGVYNRKKATEEQDAVRNEKAEKETEKVVSTEDNVEPHTKEMPTVKPLDDRGKPPLGPGLAYFETPDGRLIVGEDSKNEVWDRSLNGGQGGWVNKQR